MKFVNEAHHNLACSKSIIQERPINFSCLWIPDEKKTLLRQQQFTKYMT
jgi:hypothetical protein